MLIEPLGYRPPLGTTLAALMVGYFANLALPRLGEVTRCGSLNRSEKIPFDSLLGTVIIERVIDVLSLGVCILLVAVFEYQRLGSFFTANIIDPVRGKMQSLFGNPIFYVVIFIALFFIIYLFKRKNKNENSLLARVQKLLKGISEGLASVKKLKNPLAFLFHSVLIWFMYFLMSYTCFFALPATAGFTEAMSAPDVCAC